MKSIIYSIHIDIPHEKLEINSAYEGDQEPKSVKTKKQFEKFYHTLYQNKQHYADLCQADFKLFTQDADYDDFLKQMKRNASNLFDFDVINFYKLFLFEKLSQHYDQVLYLDFDVVINTKLNFFSQFDLNKIHARAFNSDKNSAWHQSWLVKYETNQLSFDDVVKKHLEKHNMFVKNTAKQAMLLVDMQQGNDLLINTAVLGGNKNSISKLNLFDRLEKFIDIFNTAKEDCFFGDAITDLFFLNNEVVFSYLIEKYDIPFVALDQTWHEIVWKDSHYHSKLTESKFIHAIDKNFDKVFDKCGIKI